MKSVASNLSVAYLVNQYPKISHTFIRREIHGVEALGLRVVRFSIRPCPDRLVDAEDWEELHKTQVVLGAGVWKLIGAMFVTALTRVLPFMKAFRLVVRLGWRSDRGVLWHLFYLAEACLLRKWLARENITHVHAHFGTNSAAVAMLCHVLDGTTYSFVVHGTEEIDKATILGLDLKIAHAAFVAAVSEFGRSQLFRQSSPEHWSKIHVIHTGLDESFLHGAHESIPDHGSLVCVGRLCGEKGQLLLVEAMRKLVHEGVQCRLTFVGDGEMRDEVEAAIVDSKLEHCCEITGWATTEQVRRHIIESRLLVLPSFSEGLPVVIQEALALGRPVISTYVGGIPELVEPGVNGWLVPAGSLDALCAAMREALVTPTKRLEEMGQVGMVKVKQQHSVSTETEKLHGLFKQAIGAFS